MARIDIPRLRKIHKMTQSALASKLNISQGFLSSVESGRNPFPDERIDDLQKVFHDIDLGDYQLPETHKSGTSIGSDNDHSEVTINDPEVLKSLLTFTSRQAKEEESRTHDQTFTIKEYQLRLIELSDKLEEVRKEKYELLDENLRLKDLLRRNNIVFET